MCNTKYLEERILILSSLDQKLHSSNKLKSFKSNLVHSIASLDATQKIWWLLAFWWYTTRTVLQRWFSDATLLYLPIWGFKIFGCINFQRGDLYYLSREKNRLKTTVIIISLWFCVLVCMYVDNSDNYRLWRSGTSDLARKNSSFLFQCVCNIILCFTRCKFLH
mgnify:FL=1